MKNRIVISVSYFPRFFLIMSIVAVKLNTNNKSTQTETVYDLRNLDL